MTKYRVLCVIGVMNAGGEETMLLDHLRHYNKDIFEFYLAVFSSGGDLIKKIPPDVECFILEDSILSQNVFLKQIIKVIKLRKVINNVRPHLVFSVLFDASLFVRIVRRVVNQKFIKVAREPHNSIWDYQHLLSTKDIIRAKLQSFAFADSDVIVTVSKGSKGEISKNYGIPSEKFHIIYNYIDVDKIIEQTAFPSSLPPLEHPAVVSLGRLIYRKGFQYLIQAMTKLDRAHLYLIGKGDYEAKLIEMARELGLEKRVHFLGYMDNPYNILSQGDVFAFPSLWEGFGNVILEAMACGLPVIASKCPHGPEEIITHGENGLLVEVRDVEGLAEAIHHLITRDTIRKRLSKQGFQRVKDFNTIEQVIKYDNLFLQLLAKDITL
jgi:glycosyltransferase involved in cell wall biosynthesis